MVAETAADRDSFFATDDFGEAATWRLAGPWSPPVSVTIILDNPDEPVTVGDGDALLPAPVATVRVSELPAGYGRGDCLELADGTQYRVADVAHDETRTIARAKLMLIEPEC